MRAVLDTNTVISALLFSGIASRLVAVWQSGAFRPLLSKEILEEYIREGDGLPEVRAVHS